jgi:glycosyltransferase involved in cell wall biosynthesis
VNNQRPPKIVVVTPIKNEAWILDRFLQVTSQFADHIIVADQNSTDGSVDFYGRYPKVILIRNNSEEYDEADRQKLLIQKARELIPEPKILLALDADEMLAANAMRTASWESMLKAKPGTVLCFEKPDLYFSTKQCIRYSTPWPLGYVDDGQEHKPKKVHSIRIPTPEHAPKMHIHDVKILHYAMTRPDGQASKFRLFSVLENLFKTTPLRARRTRYGYNKHLCNTKDRVELSQPEWFTGWENVGIDMHEVIKQKYYWWDFEVLKYFNKYGCRRFWLDDIWNFDWESCRLYAKALEMPSIPGHPISKPPVLLNGCLRLADKAYQLARELRSRYF